jgi:hypothetical protein
MIRMEAESPRSALTSITDSLDMLGITEDMTKMKSGGKTVDSKVHAAKGSGMYRSEFRDQLILQTTYYLNFLLANLASPIFFISSDSASTDLCCISLCLFNLLFSSGNSFARILTA